ncbi:hypothetical protein EWM64_g4887 [Hericium alpestre]|uniref:Uncharacterized protein n=1 Tax=Hericium alpestre TaxID=135208 RepID=A0A4Y9ZW68_9AGAM|nr:hypothetical protein EWM64_g4887 [Hericium alpestre]
MIIDKEPLPDDGIPTPAEAPPSYAFALQGRDVPSTQNVSYSDTKGSTSASSSRSTIPIRPSAGGSRRQSRASIRSRATSLFSFGLSKTAKQVRTTVQGLVRDLVKQPPSSEFASVLTSCDDACVGQGLSLASILQEPFIEGHLPIYWAIIKRPADPTKANVQIPNAELEEDALVMALLESSSPLSATTIAEVRHACVVNSDHALFQRTRYRFKAFAPISGTDEMLFSSTGVEPNGACDLVTIEEVRGDVGAFVARLDVILFQRRMRVSKSIKIEFIARGRIWYLVFHTAAESSSSPRAGSWLVTLGLADNSPPTHLDSRLIIVDAGSSHPTLAHTDSHATDRASSPTSTVTSLLSSLAMAGPPRGRGMPGLHQHLQQQLAPRFDQLQNNIDRLTDRVSSAADSIGSRHSLARSGTQMPPPQHPSSGQLSAKKPRPTISLRLKTGSKMLSPPGAQEHVDVTVPLEESLMGASLQYDFLMVRPRSWHWDHFYQSDKKFGNNNTHWAAYCNYCTNAKLATIELQEKQAVREGKLEAERSKNVLIIEARDAIHATAGKLSVMNNHLIQCEYCPDSIKVRARKKKVAESNVDDGADDGSEDVRSRGSDSKRPTKRVRSDSDVAQKNQKAFTVYMSKSIPFNGDRQQAFEDQILRAFISAGFAFYAIQDPEVQKLFQDYLPGAKLPNRKSLSGKILTRQVVKMEGELRASGKDQSHAPSRPSPLAAKY